MSFVFQLDGESVRQTLPEAEHVGADHLVEGPAAVRIFSAAEIGGWLSRIRRIRLVACGFLVGPVQAEESLEGRPIKLWSLVVLTAFEQTPEELAQRLALIRIPADVAHQFGPTVCFRGRDPQQREIGVQPRQ